MLPAGATEDGDKVSQGQRQRLLAFSVDFWDSGDRLALDRTAFLDNSCDTQDIKDIVRSLYPKL